MRFKLTREWELGARIDGGGFGQVYATAPSDPDGGSYVVKLVPKAPGAQRELLFVNFDGVRNVVPIVDSGEVDGHWALIMPRAEVSLRQHMTKAGGPFDLTTAIPILEDISAALADLGGKVVHRDIKPDNILFLNGKWCLADFGISRYAEATTAPDTQKYALSAPYAAPERWRTERATGATDVYALGVIGFELLSGSRPFMGPALEDYRDQHLHFDPPALNNAPAGMMALIAECLYKSPGARPSAENMLARLQTAARTPASAARARLQQVNMLEVARQSEIARLQSEVRSESERRRDLFQDASAALRQIGEELKATIIADAPAADVQSSRSGAWSVRLNEARLIFSEIKASESSPWGGWQPPAFDVIAYSHIGVGIPKSRTGYEGRGHSLWFCDARETGRYGSFETAFMYSPMIGRSGPLAPFAIDLGEGAARALWTGMAEYQLAWPFTQLVVGDLGDFIDRWVGWFAEGAEGRLRHPSMMPERNSGGSWRTK
ncbi:MAG TPA: serine/threonine protein kinase [Acetobacteraceae bacterium]|jgi:eukaryotic-like serine/threonine-protein kinase|nr:serine/threonine protein kinase [Acetobacteraceae bacterium]